MTGLETTVVETRDERLQRERNEHIPLLREDRPTRIVCLGGGTGLPTVLKGLARKAQPTLGEPGLELTAVVAMSDDGGSSGKLRRSIGVLPPGDVRNCLVALAGKNALSELFQYRFGGEKGLAGHAVGNLLLAALCELKGDFLEAVRVSSRLLGVTGTVLPSTTTPVQLEAEMDDLTRVLGESRIARARRRVKRVSLSPARPPPADGVLEALAQADLIVLGPGSLYSSIIPNLLVEGVAEALQRSRALKVLVCNLMTQPGETEGMSAADHVRAVIEHAGPVLDAALVNARPPDPEALARYAARGASPVAADRRQLIDLGVVPVEADLLKEGPRIRHDGRKVTRCLLKLARTGL